LEKAERFHSAIDAWQAEVREKPPLIARYRSSKSTARNVRMALDLEGPDRTAEIAPDGRSGIDRELSRVLKDLESDLTATVEEDSFHDVTEEMNRRSRLAQLEEDKWPLPER
jgi:hypothetical protein